MAAEDIVVKPQWVEVYPLSTRSFTIGYGGPYVSSSGDEGLWPPDLNSGHGYAMYYADEIEGFGLDDVDGNHTYGNTFWSDDQQQLGIAKRVRSSFREAFHPIIYYDLGGLPAGQWTSMELVVNLSAFDVWNEEQRSIVADYHDVATPYTAGLNERPSPPDFTTDDPGRSVIPILTVAEIAASWEHDTPVRYPDHYAPFEGSETYRWALPLLDDGGFNPGRLRGVRLLMTGGAPSGYNLVNGGCDYGGFDNDIADGIPFFEAAEGLPHLRLWYGGALAAADLSLDLTLDARPQIERTRRILEHRARQKRGW